VAKSAVLKWAPEEVVRQHDVLIDEHGPYFDALAEIARRGGVLRRTSGASCMRAPRRLDEPAGPCALRGVTLLGRHDQRADIVA